MEAIPRIGAIYVILHQLSDVELDGVMSTLVQRFPNNGVVMMWGHLNILFPVQDCMNPCFEYAAI